MADSVRRLASELSTLRTQVQALQTAPRLGYTAYTGSVDEYDDAGTLVSRLGEQHDGTHGPATIYGPVPPAPSTPLVSASPVPLTITWDGAVLDDNGFQRPLPLDFQCVQIFAALGTDPTPADLVGVITSEAGGAKSLSMGPGTWHVALRTRAASGRTSAMSEVVISDLTPPPVPTGITVDGSMAVVSVTWPGTPAMPADLARVEVAIGDTETPTALAGTLTGAGTLQVEQALAPIGAAKFVRARSVDTSGNESDWTTAVPATAEAVASGEIDAAINEAIDQALTGPVDGARLEPWTVPGNRVLIANIDNLIPDGNFQADPPIWSLPAWIEAPGTGKDGAASVLIPASESLRGTYCGLGDVATFGAPVKAGATLRMTAWARSGTGLEPFDARMYCRFYDLATGAFVTMSSVSTAGAIPANTWGEVDGTVTAPTGMGDNLVAILGVWANSTHPGALRFTLPRARLMSGATLVVDGEILARHIRADQIEAGHIKVGALDGKLITGATIRTAATGGRIEMSGSTLQAISATAGGTTVELTPNGLDIKDKGILEASYPTTADGPAVLVGRLDGHVNEPVDSFGILTVTPETDPVRSVIFAATHQLAGSYSSVQVGEETRAVDMFFVRSTDVDVYAENVLELIGASTATIGVPTAQIQAGGGRVHTWVPGSPPAGITWTDLGTPFYVDAYGAHVGYETVTNTANMYMNAGGRIMRTSSSARYKLDVEDLHVTPEQVLAIRPRTWRDAAQVAQNPDTTQRVPGFVAEEVEAAGLSEMVTYLDDGTVDGIAYDRIPAAQHIVLIDHEARITDLDTRLAALEAA